MKFTLKSSSSFSGRVEVDEFEKGEYDAYEMNDVATLQDLCVRFLVQHYESVDWANLGYLPSVLQRNEVCLMGMNSRGLGGQDASAIRSDDAHSECTQEQRPGTGRRA